MVCHFVLHLLSVALCLLCCLTVLMSYIVILRTQNLQDLKNENQRLKDENSALIRVIGKLSRAPTHQHT